MRPEISYETKEPEKVIARLDMYEKKLGECREKRRKEKLNDEK